MKRVKKVVQQDENEPVVEKRVRKDMEIVHDYPVSD